MKCDRKCVACRQIKQKKELLRISKQQDGSFHLDPQGRLGGRGAYVCSDPKCIDMVIKKRILHKVFKMNVGEGIYSELKDYEENN